MNSWRKILSSEVMEYLTVTKSIGFVKRQLGMKITHPNPLCYSNLALEKRVWAPKADRSFQKFHPSTETLGNFIWFFFFEKVVTLSINVGCCSFSVSFINTECSSPSFVTQKSGPSSEHRPSAPIAEVEKDGCVEGNHSIIESPRLENTYKISQSNHPPITGISPLKHVPSYNT